MKRFTHIAASLLCGWYLLSPRYCDYKPNRVPALEWDHNLAFDTAKECSHFLYDVLPKSPKMQKAQASACAQKSLAESHCVASDDPELRILMQQEHELDP
jgi:hypothetical protein